MTDDDRVFKALADPTRRFLLDLLFARDGRTLSELESTLEMTRYGVMKHLRVLEGADLVVSRRSGLLRRLLGHSVTHSLLTRCGISVLAVKGT